jgi:hypothetical protein
MLIEGMTKLEDYKQRMIEEYQQTKARYQKLHKMLVKHDAGTLNFTPTCPISLLKEQAENMGRYLYTLEVRAEIEGVGLDAKPDRNYCPDCFYGNRCQYSR